MVGRGGGLPALDDCLACSAAPVIAGAISMAAHLAGLDLPALVQAELLKPGKPGWNIGATKPRKRSQPTPAEPVTVEWGLDVLEIENGLGFCGRLTTLRVVWVYRAGVIGARGK